jgi:hypothetical protein
MMRCRFVSLAAVLTAAALPASAHHSIAAVYDSRNLVTVEGVVVDFLFVNPHPLVIVEVSDASGGHETWRLEMDNRFELLAIGMSAESFGSGDQVVATGSRARDGSRGLYIRRLDRPADGFWYEQVGPTPRIGIRPPR